MKCYYKITTYLLLLISAQLIVFGCARKRGTTSTYTCNKIDGSSQKSCNVGGQFTSLAKCNDVNINTCKTSSGKSLSFLGLNLAGANFSNSLFENQQLDRTRLHNVNFAKATFIKSLINNAIFQNTLFNGATISETAMTDAILDNGIIDFTAANLEKVDFTESDIPGSFFVEARLANVTLDKTNVASSNFKKATLIALTDDTDTNYAKSVFTEATLAEFSTVGNFESAQFDATNMRNINFGNKSTKVNLGSTIWNNSRLLGVKFENVDLGSGETAADFACSCLKNVSFDKADLTSASFVNAVFVNFSFDDVDTSQTSFECARNCQLTGDKVSCNYIRSTDSQDKCKFNLCAGFSNEDLNNTCTKLGA